MTGQRRNCRSTFIFQFAIFLKETIKPLYLQWLSQLPFSSFFAILPSLLSSFDVCSKMLGLLFFIADIVAFSNRGKFHSHFGKVFYDFNFLSVVKALCFLLVEDDMVKFYNWTDFVKLNALKIETQKNIQYGLYRNVSAKKLR